ncbi:MAG: thrombospondin type 3 repeat-containing protein [Planctomycetes bacterium]|nr:thrombospondin type 3 repeat-containing protein [Planctomycetota bacterium]
MAYNSDEGTIVLDGGVSFINPIVYFPDWSLTICPADTDGDGVPDYQDACPKSDLSEFIVIGGCNTGVVNQRLTGGCTMTDEVNQCADQAVKHRDFVNCVSGDSKTWIADGLIPRSAKRPLKQCTERSSIPSDVNGDVRTSKPQGP